MGRLRAIVSTVAGLRVRSRRGWDITERVQKLAGLREGMVLDGELIAFRNGQPHFCLLCEPMPLE